MAAIFQIRRGSGSVSLVDGELYVNKGPDSDYNKRIIFINKEYNVSNKKNIKFNQSLSK
jgi:hypothetical protein